MLGHKPVIMDPVVPDLEPSTLLQLRNTELILLSDLMFLICSVGYRHELRGSSPSQPTLMQEA